MFDPLLSAAPAIQVHVLTAILSLVLGPLVIYRNRRDRLHKTLGYVWVTAMAVTALSSFLIHGIAVLGLFSPIHLLSVVTLWSLFVAIRAAMRGDIHTHSGTLRGLYHYGLMIAGLFTFLPGRLLNTVFFADAPAGGWVVIGLGTTLIAMNILRGWLDTRRRSVGRFT